MTEEERKQWINDTAEAYNPRPRVFTKENYDMVRREIPGLANVPDEDVEKFLQTYCAQESRMRFKAFLEFFSDETKMKNHEQ